MNRTLMFVFFFLLVVSLFGLMQYRLYRLLRSWTRLVFHKERTLRLLGRTKVTLWILNGLFVLQFLVRGTNIYQNPVMQIGLIYPLGLFFAIVVFGFLVVSLIDVLRFVRWLGTKALPARIVPSPNQRSSPVFDERRRRFLKAGGMTAAGAVGSLPLIASIATARDYQTNRLDLSFANLPSGLEGFKIAQVSDIHSGVFMTERNMDEIFELVTSLGADMITVTGDFVDTSDSQIEPIFRAIGLLKAEYGVYGCLGNHDHFATAEKVDAAMKEKKIVMLNNSHVSRMINGASLTLLGIDDAGRGSSNFASFGRALEGSDPESFRLMLTHRPEAWDECRELGIDLTLAGHTHGGQVGFRLGPLNLNPVYLIHKYAMGHFEEDGKHLYVNVGVGMVGVPIRMVRPEVSVFTLRRGVTS